MKHFNVITVLAVALLTVGAGCQNTTARNQNGQTETYPPKAEQTTQDSTQPAATNQTSVNSYTDTEHGFSFEFPEPLFTFVNETSNFSRLPNQTTADNGGVIAFSFEAQFTPDMMKAVNLNTNKDAEKKTLNGVTFYEFSGPNELAYVDKIWIPLKQGGAVKIIFSDYNTDYGTDVKKADYKKIRQHKDSIVGSFREI